METLSNSINVLVLVASQLYSWIRPMCNSI